MFVLLFVGARRLTASIAGEGTELREEYQALVRKLHVIREEERARLARDIHDDLGQVLTGVKMDIALTIRRLAKNERETALQKLDESSSSVDNAIQSLRRLAMTLPGLFSINWGSLQPWNGKRGSSKLAPGFLFTSRNPTKNLN